MIEVLVWLLISTSDTGMTSVVERFRSSQECERVNGLIPKRNMSSIQRCIQANVLVPK